MNPRSTSPADEEEKASTLTTAISAIVTIGIIALAALPWLWAAVRTAEKKAASSPSPSSSASPAPSASPVESAPAVHSAPVEFPWAIVLGIGMTVIMAIVAVALIVWFARKNKAAIAASRNNLAGWDKLISRHRELRAAWASYELDMAKLIDYPLMTDMREPVTIALHKALNDAAALEPDNAKKMSGQPATGSDFWNAVSQLDVAFHTAEQTAKKVAWSRFTRNERKSLANAKNLLALAMDAGASPAERQAAYKRVFKELEGLIEFPEKARLEIEARHQLSLAA